MPKCNRCETHVTTDFTRVFGDNDDEVYGCQHCLEKSVPSGAAAGVNPAFSQARGRSAGREERDGNGAESGAPDHGVPWLTLSNRDDE